jgi:hypothetical protein
MAMHALESKLDRRQQELDEFDKIINDITSDNDGIKSKVE